MATKTASALSKSYSRPGIHLTDNFEAVVAAGLDEVFKRDLERPQEGKQFFRPYNMGQRTIKFQSYYGLGAVGQNRDSESLPYDEIGLGFGWELTSNTFRGAIRIEKELEEDELYGVVSDLQTSLVESYRTTVELVCADAFNRALGTAPFLCEDGMYLIDSARPQPFKQAGTWSNLESAGALTIASLYQTQLNFAANTDERGYLSPLQLRRIIVRPTDEKGLWEILKSDLRPTDAMNAKNFMFGRYEYTVYNYLTSAYVFFMAGDPNSPQNELYFGDRVAPELETWQDGSNPDITHQRIRARFGLGCGRPQFFRGQDVS